MPVTLLEANRALKAHRERLLRWVVLSVATGVGTGLMVALFQYLVRDLVEPILYETRHWGLYLVLPAIGLVLSCLCIRYLVPTREGELTEDFIAAYHEPNRTMPMRNLPGKAFSSFITSIFGGSVGLEGPSIFMGATLGEWLQIRFNRYFPLEDSKMLMVAGAAAGLSAIFKAPLTGIIFAVEVPYRDSVRGRVLVPTLLASASSYVTSVLLGGTEHIFEHPGPHGYATQDMIMAAILGVCCGFGARAFSWLHHTARRWMVDMPGTMRPLIAGGIVGLLTVLIFILFGEPYLFGPGYRLMHHLLVHRDPLWLLMILLAAKAVATAFTFAGGGTGGIFFPLAAMGMILGTAFSHILQGPTGSLYPLIGLAAFLGAGYRAPVAAVAFIAESSGNPWALLPGMVAAVASFTIMGESGVSDEQRNL